MFVIILFLYKKVISIILIVINYFYIMNKIFVVLAIAIAAASCKSLRFLEAESMRNLVDNN